MGNNLGSYRRSSGNGKIGYDKDKTETLKAHIRPQTGIGIMDLHSAAGVGDQNESGLFPGTRTTTLLQPGNTNSLIIYPPGSDPTQNFVRNRKDLVSMRSSKYSPKTISPIPSSDELEKRFTKVLVSLILIQIIYEYYTRPNPSPCSWNPGMGF